LTLTVLDPARFLAADHYGGFAVGLIVVVTGLRVAKDSSDSLADAMPPPEMLEEIRRIATSNPQIRAVEKCYARNTGLQYHVDLHIQVDPGMSVLESHKIATQVRFTVREKIDWVADVLVHVEPWTEPVIFDSARVGDPGLTNQSG
jgi:divalent metal cation (Fe/Co/Zn/Cd) transporter